MEKCQLITAFYVEYTENLIISSDADKVAIKIKGKNNDIAIISLNQI